MEEQVASQNSEAGILGRLIQARQGKLSRDVAEYLLSLRFNEDDLSRVDELSEFARQGTLSEANRAELDSYIHVSNLLAVIQSKARMALRESQ